MSKQQFDVIIIGAGACGLMAMRHLTEAGISVCLIEAASAIGGRISTLNHPEFDSVVETGAEFIHGKCEQTFALLKEARIHRDSVTGAMVPVQKGKWLSDNEEENYFDQLGKVDVQEDRSIRQLLDENFSTAEYRNMRTALQSFAEGFDLADIDRASAISFLEEAKSMDEPQYRVRGGYQLIVDYLFEKCRIEKNAFQFSSPVFKVELEDACVSVYTLDNNRYKASNVIITASLGVLKSGSIQFFPALDKSREEAFSKIGYGSVVKILFQFKQPFWKKRSKDLGFILSDEKIPTWWTQYPTESNILTGWLGGPQANIAQALPGNELYEMALQSLSNIFEIDLDALRNTLTHHKIICWGNQPHARGGYSYNTLESNLAKEILLQPIDNKIFFAGEGLHQGEHQGTVEAALLSGKLTAERIINGR
jgi:monoamine oxidase